MPGIDKLYSALRLFEYFAIRHQILRRDLLSVSQFGIGLWVVRLTQRLSMGNSDSKHNRASDVSPAPNLKGATAAKEVLVPVSLEVKGKPEKE